MGTTELTGLACQLTGGYLHVFCAACGAETDNTFIGGDPIVPYFVAFCPYCKAETEVRLMPSNWENLQLKRKRCRVRLASGRLCRKTTYARYCYLHAVKGQPLEAD